MAPRTYTQDRRAESTAATRRRILDATLDLYKELGVPATTLAAVADRADVSRGTILNHFGSSEGLLGAAADLILEREQLPDDRIFEGRTSKADRIRAFVEAMIDFQERSSPWWPVFEHEIQRPELKERELRYWEALAGLQAAALGPELATDPRANAALTSVIHPATVGTFLWSFEQAGLKREEARPLLSDFAVSVVEHIARGKGKGGKQ
jgi:AcrR family transcriptional regulator